MTDYCNYKYEFEPSNQKWVFKENGEKVDAEMLRQKFSKHLTDANVLAMSKMIKGQVVSLSCYVIGRRGDVFILALHNVKSIKQWQEMKDEPEKLTSLPHCKVIVDNRDGVQQILVEKNEAFDGKPDSAIKIIKEYMDQLYQALECSVKISAKMLVCDVWKAVNMRRENGQRVTSVSFKIGEKDQIDTTSGEAKELLECMSKFNQKMGGALAEFRSSAKSKSEMAFIETNKDCFNLVKLIANNGYEMIIRFSSGGQYNTKKQSTATFKVLENIVSDFIDGQKTIEGKFRLEIWLDNIRSNSEEYSDVTIKTNKSVA